MSDEPKYGLSTEAAISYRRTKPRTTALNQDGDGGASITGLLDEILLAWVGKLSKERTVEI